MPRCGKPCEVWTRCVGYFRPVSAFNKGKKQEFKDRKPFKVQSLAELKKINRPDK